MASRERFARGSQWRLPSGRYARLESLKGYYVTLRYTDADESVELLLSFLTEHGVEA